MFHLGVPPVSAPVIHSKIAGGYTQIPQKFYHPNAGRNALGLVGGNDVSLIAGNMVDLESELKGITRDLSNTPSQMYHPSCALGSSLPAGQKEESIKDTCPPYPAQIVFEERGTGVVKTISTAPRHLPTFQMFSYPGVPKPKPFVQEVYGAPWRF
jgi:hypothetical protein